MKIKTDTSTLTLHLPTEMKNELLHLSLNRKMRKEPNHTITDIVVLMLKKGLIELEQETKLNK